MAMGFSRGTQCRNVLIKRVHMKVIVAAQLQLEIVFTAAWHNNTNFHRIYPGISVT